MDILKEAQELYALGWAVHYIKPNSKAPVKAGWSGPERDSWEVFIKDYHEGYGLGVRLGEPSKISGGYLANIDVDIKSSDARHREEALAFLESKFPHLLYEAPIVKTGYGLRLFVKTEKPLPSGKLGSSNERTVVYMPTAPINPQQLKACKEGFITQKQLDEGYRVRPAWELEFMSAGKQVVLPPSIHPETKKAYIWERGVKVGIPAVHVNGHLKAESKGATYLKDWTPVEVDLDRLSLATVMQITNGVGVDDRSAALLGVSMAMVRKGFTDQEILSVLTDRQYFLGQVAYEHRGHTRSRLAAAAWINDYTLKKAKEIVDAKKAFEDEVEVSAVLDEAATAAQATELLGSESKPKPNWRNQLDRTKEGNIKATSLKNVVLILKNVVSETLFLRDEFTNRDFYGVVPPWGGQKGTAITDDDAIKIKHWLSRKFKIEPPVGIIFEAIITIATDNAFHPIRDELNALPPWDGKERLDGWLKQYFEAKGPDEYLAQVFRKWLVASVKRTFEPGAKFDWMIIFEGPQGIGKSMFGSILFGQRYFADWLPRLEDKDAALGLQGKRCVEFGELDQLRRNEVETIKAFVARQVDNVRPPYGRRSIEIYRQCVFIGSTNKEHYLKDDTGNRRFNPMVVGSLDFGALNRDREQLWAEALFIYQNGLEPDLELEGEAKMFALKTQRDKLVLDDANHMADEIAEFYETQIEKPKEERKFDFARFKIKDFFGPFGPLNEPHWKPNSAGLQHAAKALKLLKLRNFNIKYSDTNGTGRWSLWRE